MAVRRVVDVFGGATAVGNELNHVEDHGGGGKETRFEDIHKSSGGALEGKPQV